MLTAHSRMNSSTHSNLTVAPGRYDDADGGGCGVDESALGSPRYSASSIAGVFGLACGINADVGSCDESDNCAWDVASSACGVSDGITATITGLLAAARAPPGATCTDGDSSRGGQRVGRDSATQAGVDPKYWDQVRPRHLGVR